MEFGIGKAAVALALAVAGPALGKAADRLPTEAEYDFRTRLERIHEKGRRDAAERPAADERELKDGFTIALPADASDFVVRVVRDFEDYLLVSMDVAASVTRGAGDLAFAVDGSLPARQYRLSVADAAIRIVAHDERALAQAFYHLEDLMNLRRAPFLKRGTETRTPRFATRMTHSGYGNDIFPDAHLNQMAHAGMTAILVFLDDIDKTKAQDYQDLKALIRRARKYGLDTYLYSYIKAFAHPDDGPAAFDASYGRIAGFYPEAKGIILVGESCQFPSKDPRVQPVLYPDKDPKDPRPLAGWFPCADYPRWLAAVTRAIRAKAPDMEVVFWTYNWGWAPVSDRLKLIDALPKDVTLMATFEMFERRTKRNGIDTPTADYTISFAGPGQYFVSEAAEAKRQGLALYTQANAGGLTWDFGVIPYQPVPMQWRRRWEGLNAAHAAWGLDGIMENHHFGWWPSFVSELEKEALTEGGIPFDRHVRLIAARDFGEANADRAVAVWKRWSERAEDYVPTDANQYGPFRIGPAYPFTFGHPAVRNDEFPTKKYASNSIGICRLDYLRAGYVPQLTPERMDAAYMEKEIELLVPMAVAYEEGAKAFAEMPGRRAAEMANFAGYLAACVRTAINVKRGAIALLAKDTSGVLSAARAEYANATRALDFVARDSRLGWEPSMEYTGGPEQIRWKLRRMEDLYGREALSSGGTR